MGFWDWLKGKPRVAERPKPIRPAVPPTGFSRRPAPLPQNRNRILTGFWWNAPPSLPLAASRGFDQEVVGESFRQEALEAIVGGYGQYGCIFHTTAQLALPTDMPDHPKAVAVLIETKHVGFLPSADSAQVREELLALPGSENGVTCKAVIRGGWDQTANGGDRGHFGVWLSLSRPLKIKRP